MTLAQPGLRVGQRRAPIKQYPDDPQDAPVALVAITSVTPPSLGPGDTFQVTVEVRSAVQPNPDLGPGNVVLTGRTVSWATSNAAVATVNSSGLVSYVGAGSCTITATCEGVPATQAITCVSPQAAVSTVAVTPSALTGAPGLQAQVSATPRDSGSNALVGRTVTWATSNAAVATVGADSGTDAHTASVVFVGVGSATITATCETIDGTTAVTVSTVNVGPANPTLPTPLREFYVDAAAGSDSNNGSIGAPFQTMTKVRTTAIPGDRFYLKGTFTGETVNRLGTVSNAGTVTNPIQVVVWPGETATMSGGGGASQYPTIWGSSNMRYWMFKDLDFVLPTSSLASAAFYGAGSQNVTFIGCSFHGAGHSKAIFAYQSTDIHLYECSFTGVYGNLAANTGDIIFCLDGAHRFRAVRCVFTASSYHVAITLGGIQNQSQATSTDPWIVGCTISNTVAGGINVNGHGHRAIIEHTTFYDIATNSSVPSKTGVAIAAPDCIVRYNRGWNMGREFIKLSAYSYNSVIQTPNRVHVHNNTGFDIDGMAVSVTCATSLDPKLYLIDMVVENNAFWKVGQTLVQTGAAGELLGWWNGTYYPLWINCYNTSLRYNAGSIGGNIFRNNLFARSASNSDKWMLGVRTETATNNTYTLAQFESTFAGCADNIEKTDAMFLSEVTPDLGLAEGSPCIDAGYATVGVSYNGTAPDIGYLESNY